MVFEKGLLKLTIDVERRLIRFRVDDWEFFHNGDLAQNFVGRKKGVDEIPLPKFNRDRQLKCVKGAQSQLE